jgi:hypothetical protein
MALSKKDSRISVLSGSKLAQILDRLAPRHNGSSELETRAGVSWQCLIMKKIFSTALVLQLLVCALFTPALWAEEKREFISKTMNADVQKLFENCGREIIGAEPFSSKNNNIMDYMIGFYNTDYGLLVTLQTLKKRLDEYGRAMPDVYNSELVAVVFVDRVLLWYKSQTAKSTLKTQMARLIRNRSI